MSDHGGNNVVHVAGKKRMQEMMTVASDAGEQLFISFGADAIEGQCGQCGVLAISSSGGH